MQLDYVNLLAPAHYLVLFSRLGPYKKTLLDDLLYRRREFTELWAHEASIVPMETWPLLRYRRESHRVRPWGFEKFLASHPAYVGWVLEQVRDRGPLAARELTVPEGVERRLDLDWFGTVPRAALEAHFGCGALAIAAREPNFTRVYDLAERVIPPELLHVDIPREEAQRDLLLQAVRAHGVATAGDLADYWRMPVSGARPRITELVEAGRLRTVHVEGWREPALLDPGARAPDRVDAAALLAPFDPLIWTRARTARLFGFEYRFEIFVPPAKRKWGTYVLPFLLGDRLVARVDLKADRDSRRLRVVAASGERGVNPGAVAEALVRELRSLAGWLELDSIGVERRGDLARHLRALVGRA